MSYKERRELEELPDRIEALEEARRGLHQAMADPAFYRQEGGRIAEARARLEAMERELAGAYERWEALEGLNGWAAGADRRVHQDPETQWHDPMRRMPMCGRYTLRKPAGEVAEEFDVPEVFEFPPRYNIAPTQDVPIVRLGPDRAVRQWGLLHWGLIPSWADDPAIGHRMINARAETVAEKPAFRQAFKSRRCLVVADGFFEWAKLDGRKQPYLIHRKDDRPFAFAGLWERWARGGEPIESCTIITTQANELMQPIHDRMPVIIPRTDYDLWLDPAVKDPGKLQSLLLPSPADELEAYPVSTLVNHPRNDVEGCIRSVG